MNTNIGSSPEVMSEFRAAAMQATAADESIRMIVETASANPFASAMGIGASSNDYYGAFSVEKFAAASDLYDTHEDAQGWLAYVEQFQPRNFWYRDSGVGVWAYYETYDNWQDTYGMDAVMACYHSGHGAMDSNGVFYAAMGSNWGGLGTNAVSSQMALGNEQVRYIFWSTCFSLRVLGGHNPIRSWYTPNLGFRMLFGYETTSVDAPNYGKDFWKQWNKGKSFSQAHLDMSWYDVSTHQAPSVVACGATPQEAQDRLYNERFFNWGAVGKAYWHWRWYYAATSALAMRSPNRALPQRLATAQLAPASPNANLMRAVMNRVPVAVALPGDVPVTMGTILIGDNTQRIAFESNGTYEAQLTSPNLESTRELPLRAAIDRAQDIVRQFGLDRNDIMFDRVLLKYDCAGSTVGAGSIGTPRVTETVVQFTQRINGLPVIGPGQGKVSVTLDNDQNVTAVLDTTREIARLEDNVLPPEPVPSGRGGVEPPFSPVPETAVDPDRLLAAAWQERMKIAVVRGKMPLAFAPVPGSTEVGYVIRGNSAQLVARQEVEVDCGGGFLKRFIVESPIVA
jgi:hypothetical protein